MGRAVELADYLGVSVLWLLQGVGPKFAAKTDENSRLVGEAAAGMPPDARGRVLNYLQAEITMHKGWFARESEARYLRAIEQLASTNKESHGGGVEPPQEIPMRAHA